MFSMTGYGRGEYNGDGIFISAEIKTVNNRYLDLSVKCPRIFSAVEEKIKGLVREKLTRGHADIFISLSDKRGKLKEITLDEGAAAAYVNAAKRVGELFPEVENDLSVTSILRFPEVLRSEDSQSADEELTSALFSALSLSLDNLNAMRLTEGEKLKADMLARMDVIEQTVAHIAERAPLVAQNYRVKLEAKIKKILEGNEPDEDKILTEVALFADKSNIDEELTRLGSHIAQFREISKSDIVGRKLDFLVQEFNREANTICSKSNDIEITRLALSLKNEIEKVREQVQNIE